MKAIALLLLASAALAACGSEADNVHEEPVVGGETAAGTPSPSPAPLPSAAPSLAVNEIPAAAQGRWGLVAADCEPGRADAKGLLTVGPRTLKFYESLATLDGDIDELSATRMRADFDFEGEGMTWDRELALEVEDGGRTLVRTEYGDDAAPEPFRYSKCG